MLKRYFYVKIYPALYLSFKPVLALLLLLSLIFFLGIYFGFFRAPFVSSNPEEAVPSNSCFVVKIKNPSDFNKNISKLPYFENINAVKPFEQWRTEYICLDSLLEKTTQLKNKKIKKEVLSCLTLNGKDFVWTHIIPLSKFDIAQFAKENKFELLHKSQFLKSEIYEYRHPQYGNWVFTFARGLLIASRQVSFVEASLVALNNTGNNLPFDSRFNMVKNSYCDLSFYANLELLPFFLTQVGNEASLAADPIFRNFSWSGGEIKFTNNNLILGGKLTLNSTGSFWNWLAGQSQKSEPTFAGLIPENFAFVRYLNITNFKNSRSDFNPDFNKYVLPWLSEEAVFLITEPTENTFNADKFFILKSKDSISAGKLINQFGNDFGILENLKIKNRSAIKISASALLKPIFGDNVEQSANFYCLIEGNYVVFAGSATVLETWIENYTSGKTIDKLDTYKSMNAQIKQAAAACFIVNAKSMLPFLKIFSDEKTDLYWDKNFKFFEQFGPIVIHLKSLGSNSFSLSLNCPFDPKGIEKTETNLVWRCNLEADVAISPSQVYNPVSKESEIMVQDSEKRLYLISRTGEIIWKKPLDSKVQSKFHQIDFYSNGELQYVFNTLQSIYILDKNGEVLKKIALASKASNGLNVFSNNKEIRLFVGCSNGKVYGYDKNGKPISGWNPNSKTGTVHFPIQYYNYNGKKLLICMSRKGKLYMADNEGKTYKSIFLEANFPEGIFTDSIENKLYACSNSGKIDIIDFEGRKKSFQSIKELNKNVSFCPFDFNNDGKIDFARLSGTKLIVHTLDENKKLKEIFNYDFAKKQDLIFSVKYNSSGKNLIASYNMIDKELNLLDFDKKIIKGFPIITEPNYLFTDLFNDNGSTLIYTKGKTLSAIKIK